MTNKKHIVCSRYLGTAPVYPQVKWMKEQGYEVDCIIGARSKDLSYPEDKMREVAANVYVSTDDGSYGLHGNVNDCIRDLIENKGKR